MRTQERVLSLLIGLAILLVAALTLVESVAAAAGRGRPVLVDWRPSVDWLQTQAWRGAWVLGIGAVLIVLGLILVRIALRRTRSPFLILASVDPAVVAGVTLDGVRRTVGSAVQAVPGVAAARVRVRPVRVEVRATATVAELLGLQDQVQAAAERSLSSLGLAAATTVAVDVVPPS